MRPLLLDLFCKAGGAAWGYHQAGFDVIGIDIEPQPNYPFPMYQEDALVVLQRMVDRGPQGFSAIHASPPCQSYSSMKHMPDAREHPQLVEPVRELLKKIGLPYVIENVPGAPLHNPITLCGSMFGLQAEGFQLRRHRQFESNMELLLPGPCAHTTPVIGVYGGHVRCRSSKYWRAGAADFPGYDKKRLAMEAMGVEHRMTMDELSEAIPPAFTNFVGSQLLESLSVVGGLSVTTQEPQR